LFLFNQCDDKEKYYARPDWLESPIYNVLEQQGNFTLYLQCVDRTKYANVMKGAGLYTVFAPNDDAVRTFLSQKNYASVKDIPDSEVDKIVAYSMCYSPFVLDSLGVQGTFKYKSQLYALPYRDPEYNNEWVVDQTLESGWTSLSNNYKFVPVFTSAFFNSYTPALTAADYNVFFPGISWTGKNIQSGEVMHADLRAENGIIQEVSTVNYPLDNISDILKRPENSGFKSLVDSKDAFGEYLFRYYMEVTDPTTLRALQKIMPNDNIQKIYYKFYGGLAYSFNLENVVDFGAGIYQPEKAGYTLIVPSNAALTEYLNRRILKYYTDVKSLPYSIIRTFINAHMIQALVWPANYAMSLNANGDYLNGEGSTGKPFAQSGITGAVLASNGFVYPANDVVHSRIFESVYSEIFLNSAHQWVDYGYLINFNTTLREDLQKCILNGFISERYTLLVFDDQLLKDDGFSFDPTTGTFTHATSGVNATTRLTRLMREHIFNGLKNAEVNSEITDFAAKGISQYGGWNFAVTNFGDPVRYQNNQIQAAGNIEDNTKVNLTKIDDNYLNGTVWRADKMLQFSPRVTGGSDEIKFRDLSLWEYLDRARTQNPNVKMFVDYLQQCVKTYPADATSTVLDGISPEQFYTVLMLNTGAMQSAINAGVLPPLADVTASNPDAFAKAAFFIKSHILQGRVFVDDNIPNYLYPANAMGLNRALVPVLAKVNDEKLGLTNQSLFVEVSKVLVGTNYNLKWVPQNVTQGSTVLVTGAASNTVTVQRGTPTGTTIPDNYRSNRIACRAILHEVNNYFTFKTVNP
jgi:hypothetical protein